MLYDNICFFGGASEESNLTWLPLYLSHFVPLSHLSYLTTTPSKHGSGRPDQSADYTITNQTHQNHSLHFHFCFESVLEFFGDRNR